MNEQTKAWLNVDRFDTLFYKQGENPQAKQKIEVKKGKCVFCGTLVFIAPFLCPRIARFYYRRDLPRCQEL